MVLGYIYNTLNYYFNNIKNAFKIINLIYFITSNDITRFDTKGLNKLKFKLINNGAIAIKFMRVVFIKKNFRE